MKYPLLLANHGVTIVVSTVAIIMLVRGQMCEAGVWTCASLLSSIRSDIDGTIQEAIKLMRNTIKEK